VYVVLPELAALALPEKAYVTVSVEVPGVVVAGVVVAGVVVVATVVVVVVVVVVMMGRVQGTS